MKGDEGFMAGWRPGSKIGWLRGLGRVLDFEDRLGERLVDSKIERLELGKTMMEKFGEGSCGSRACHRRRKKK